MNKLILFAVFLTGCSNEPCTTIEKGEPLLGGLFSYQSAYSVNEIHNGDYSEADLYCKKMSSYPLSSYRFPSSISNIDGEFEIVFLQENSWKLAFSLMKKIKRTNYIQ